MQLEVRRRFFFTDHTAGDLFIDGSLFCRTMEDRLRDPGEKVPGKTCIPAGRYRVTLTMSARFKRIMPLLNDVPGFAGIRIHPGNTATDTDGCILVGMAQEIDLERGRIGQSRVTFDRLMAALISAKARGEEIWVEVI